MCIKNYEILSGDTLVALWNDNKLTVYNEKLLPLFLKNISDGDLWLEKRAIDSHRANSRLLKKALRMKERDDLATVIQANGATITDNYWIREPGSSLKYADISFDENYFRKLTSKSAAKLALDGSSSSFNYIARCSSSPTAELTNTGSFEKCWRNVDGKWWLYKSASKNEMFSEVFISRLCNEIGINCAVYKKDKDCVKSLDFTDGKVNFEPAFTFMGDEEDYGKVIEKLKEICPGSIPDYIRLIFLDALVFNPDRHTANFGLLRDKKSGSLLGLAPCFDHNMALISRGYPTGNSKNDLLIKLFCEVIKENPEYKKYIPSVTENDIENALAATGMNVKSNVIKQYIINRYNLIEEDINNGSI